MTCQDFKDLIQGDRLPEELTTAERRAIVRHMRECRPCGSAVREVAVEVMSRVPAAELLDLSVQAMNLAIKDHDDREA